MSSFKTHALAGILMALPFVPNLFYLFFAVIGASIPDMDHKHNKNKVHIMFLMGIIISLLLILLKGSVISGIIVMFVAIIFYFSKHRGFTHSIVGATIICLLLLFMMMGFLPVVTSIANYVGYVMPNNLSVFVILSLLGYFVISRRVLTYYVIVLAASLFIAPVNIASIDWVMIFVMLFIGVISHMILDLRTPSGLAVFWPISNEVYHKKVAFIFVLIWVFFAVYYVVRFGTIFESFGFLLNYI